MSDHSANPARPVSLFTIVILFVLFAAGLFVVRWAYKPASAAPFNAVAEKLPKDLEWKASSASRRAMLNETRAQQQKQLTSYEKKEGGNVHLAIDRAMELTAQQYSAKK